MMAGSMTSSKDRYRLKATLSTMTAMSLAGAYAESLDHGKHGGEIKLGVELLSHLRINKKRPAERNSCTSRSPWRGDRSSERISEGERKREENEEGAWRYWHS